MPTTTTTTTTSNRKILKDSDSSWTRVPFLVTFGTEFTRFLDAVKYVADANDDGSIKGDTNSGISINAGSAGEVLGLDYFANNAAYLTRVGTPAYTDTRCGANDAINCIWQFNRDDDIVHPINQTEVSGIGLGRVYAETTQRNQTIAYFTFGVPVFSDILTFYSNAFDREAITYNVTGGFSLSSSLGRLFNTALRGAVLALTIPLLPLKILGDVITRSKQYNIDRFYDLRTTMHSYYRYVDSILVQWSIGVGFYGNGSTNTTPEAPGLPDILSETGLSIFNLLAIRGKLLARANGSDTGSNYDWEQDLIDMSTMKATEFDGIETTDSGQDVNSLSGVYDYSLSNNKTNGNRIAMWNNNRVDFSSTLINNVFGATQFIGFRVEKSTDASESFSNSTGPNPIAEKFNEMARNNMVNAQSGLGISNANTGLGPLDSMLNLAGSVLTGAADIAGVGGLAEAVLGNAFVDVPESYRSSDFSKSHSLNFQLRAPYGDVISIYQSIMVPLALLLAAALPRAGGPWSYVQPFLCRVYVKGMFSIPLGIIDSLSIKRGSSEFGWTYKNLPTRVDVSLSIKDLSPLMYMAMTDGISASGTGGGIFQGLLETNSTFKEYLLTLSGVGLHDRISRFANFKRNLHYTITQIRRRYGNPAYWASSISDTAFFTAVGSLLPFNRVPFN